MKTALLLIILSVSYMSFGQKRILSTKTTYYEMNGDINLIDSSFNVYNSQQVGLTSVKPEFVLHNDFYNYDIRSIGSNFNVKPDQTVSYSGTALPLAYSLTYTNTLANGLFEVTSSGGNWRTVNEYDAQGNLTRSITENGTPGNWVPLDSTTYTYDANGNQLTRTVYDVTTLDAIVYTDSSWYVAGTNQLEKFISYSPLTFGGPLFPIDQLLITYNGANIEYQDSYFNLTGTNVLDWMSRAVYEYNGAEPTKYSIYNVVNNVLATAPNDIVEFLSNAQNVHYSDVSYTTNGDTTLMNVYTYDAEGFVTNAKYFLIDLNSELYLAEERFYYYEQAPLGINETPEMEVSVFPNPSSGLFTIDFEQSTDDIQGAVYDNAGRIMQEFEFNGNQAFDIDLSQNESGVYSLVMLVNGKRAMTRLIVQ